ncbi:MAG: E1 ubiquitin-activating protein uba2 [Lichina confinis]|nr:MAG: E1 ubiquitin-activating protein uba2 [Lichina confinis]
MGRQDHAKRSLGWLYGHVAGSRTLLVGAGGIGCELLKNLVLTGFGEIHIVDLDTIDLSNLNRQFLFRREHIKKSKALVAKEAAGRYNPNVKLEAHHANIKDPRFNIDWFKSFDVVFNALDNVDARRHVNRMCLAADVPLVESGTTGFNGQVQVIKKVPRAFLSVVGPDAEVQQGKTECYDCNVKEALKSFPVCTIRTTPSQPIHSIVWAKSYLFTELFGTSEDDAPELDHTENQENADEIETLRRESQALRRIRQARGSKEFARRVFEKVYSEDIERLRSMENLWKTRNPPVVLDHDRIVDEARSLDASTTASNDQATWNLSENFGVFSDSLDRLGRRMQHLQARMTPGDPPPILTFDKDDVDTLDFVASSANLRSIVFGIEPKSKFDIKQMAGNIIPAIATTNAMIAGLCVLQAFKVMQRKLENARMIFLVKSTHRVISAERLAAPNPECPACSVAQSRVAVDTSRATLKDLVEDFLRLELGYGDEFSVNNDVGVLYDPDLDDNLEKSLTTLGVRDESFLTIIDEDDEDPRVNLVLSITDTSLPEPSKPIRASEKVEIGRRPKPTDSSQTRPTTVAVNGHTTNGASNGATPVAMLGKRKRTAGSSEGNDDVVRHDDDNDEDESSRQVKRRGIVPEEDTTADVTTSTTGLEASIKTAPVRTLPGSTLLGGGSALGGTGGVDRDRDGDGVIVLDEEEDAAGAITIEDDL